MTATKQVYNTNEIESIAGVADISDILELQADVVDDHFRGGRLGESSYLIGGGTIVNPLTNRRAFSPIVTGLQQVEVYTSGFSAEYGNAQSGVVNMVAKEGGNKWETRLEVAGIPSSYKTFNGSPYDPSNLYFYNELQYTEAWLQENPTQPGRSLFDAGYGFGPLYLPPRDVWPPLPLTQEDSLFIAQIGQLSWLQSIRDVGLEYDNFADYRFDLSLGGPLADNLTVFFAGRQNENQPIVPTPENDLSRQLMANFTYRPDNENKFGFRLLYDYQFENDLQSNWERWLFDRTFSVTKYKSRSLNYALSWNHIISQATFMDIKLGLLDVYQEDRIELLYDDQFIDEYSDGTNWVDYTGPSFHRVGRLNDDRGEEHSFTYNINASLTSQVNKGNLVKAGLQFYYYDINVDRDLNVTNEGSYRNVKFSAYPYEGALYVQDKMEYLGFVANIGLRYDFYNFNTPYYTDRYSPLRNPNYDSSLPYLDRGQYYDRDLAAREDTKLFTRLQPRIGLSFPLSERMVFHLNYGTFTQRPNFNLIFYNQVTKFNEIEILGNPELKPENTKAYDIGLVTNVAGLKFDVSAYYKDVTDLVQRAYFYDEQQTVYSTYINRDYADIKGFHVSIEKEQGGLRGYARYNYETATGKSSNELDAPLSFFEQPAEGQESIDLPDPEDVYMDYDRTHKAVFNLRYFTGKEFLFGIGDIYPLENVSLSVTYKYYTGRPYTYDETGQGLKFNKRTPIERDLKLRLEKRIKISGDWLTVYLEGFNLLNQFVYSYSRTFNNDRNTPKWELDRDNILVYDEYEPFTTSQEVYLIGNQPRHFRLGVIYKF
ncbi:MAG: hypothetical protein SCALA702_38560 [Melioribacteraceae bacterium]|nr:MAG: hypothetical protein SCALA702_38560 [Melioribacteraceae bacterium]